MKLRYEGGFGVCNWYVGNECVAYHADDMQETPESEYYVILRGGVEIERGIMTNKIDEKLENMLRQGAWNEQTASEYLKRIKR